MALPHTGEKTRDLSLVALMAALIALCAWLTLPIGPVPFTMQTFAIFAALGLLGGKRGSLAVGVYLLLGLVGLPVFSGFGAGPGTLLGATGGYLLGFLLLALTYWLLTARLGTSLPLMVLSMIAGLVVCYAFGTAWYVLGYTGGGTATLLSTLSLCVFPYLLPDALKLVLALLLVRRLRPHL
ncbi:MAG: biotin transporter BioY [Evtepia sp.]|uniref:biotin transporter BioY n=1 Tax=Evtepia sp. TaxID=2773933 RepID=UPI002A75A103|nr:biotin transporter BioY [Evtepia sp.]MDY3015317.1 biotin transporter BioY [Evtepia sp.]